MRQRPGVELSLKVCPTAITLRRNMLADRHYMRQPSYSPRWSFTVILLIINVAVFLAEALVRTARPGFPLNEYFALSVVGLKHGYIWQLLTYQFMHAGWLHLLLNGWAIFMFGREVESTLGRTKFLTLYFSSGIIGGLLQALGTILFPYHFGYTEQFGWPSVVGASAAAFGLVAAFATLYQLENQNPSFGQGMSGYATRVAAAYGDQMIGNMMTEAIVPSLLHEDPRYFRLGEGSGWSRARYAAAAALSNAWYPDTRTVSDNAQKLLIQCATDAFSNVLKEFWPDVKRHFQKKHDNVETASAR